MFRGNHPAKVDEKGRLKVPAAFKQLMDAANVTQFYITSTNGKSAEIWPLPEWEKVEARLAGASALNVAVKTFMNLVNYYGQQVEIDSQGRLLLPQILRTKASLDAEVTVIGMRTYVEVHNREKFEQDLPPEGLTDEHQQAIDEILSGRDDH
jgi:MraZ protein